MLDIITPRQLRTCNFNADERWKCHPPCRPLLSLLLTSVGLCVVALSAINLTAFTMNRLVFPFLALIALFHSVIDTILFRHKTLNPIYVIVSTSILTATWTAATGWAVMIACLSWKMIGKASDFLPMTDKDVRKLNGVAMVESAPSNGVNE
ncbi:Protein of unknown function [Pyronema omphalodes CBS 100304]|uniref:Uncharacterized protein n=1 Tax=Pyronema omphalodes (strain CBS 100304) TaxID=1076935 RepID=U4LKX4_PYROM|nr:Protein of unknown function [Pyronema omphalodes CBS 100304]